MRAPFNRTVTLFDGPGTATPGFPRVVDADCRLVSDLYFREVEAPTDQSVAYFTISSAQPFGPTTAEGLPGIWSFDYTKADRAEFSGLPGLIWVVVRVELCTWQSTGAPYWRGHVVESEEPPSACSVGYFDQYQCFGFGGPPSGVTVSRTGPTTWTDGTYTLQAELTPPVIDCNTLWRLTDGTAVWEATSDGSFVQTFTPVAGSAYNVNVFPVP